MKILVTSTSQLLDSKLSIAQRGLLITALLLRDINPKLTLAKFKASIKINEHLEDLIHLHESGFIQWSGYASALKSLKSKQINPQVIEIVDFMNQLWKRKFDSSAASTTSGIKSRLQKHSVEDIKLVIANRYEEWKDDSLMSKYLTPTTIFRPSKFDKYLEEAKRTKSGQSFVHAKQIDLKHGDTITQSLANTFIDKDVYEIRTYDIDAEGRRLTSGMLSRVYGATLKKMLKVEQNKIDRGFSREFEYVYQQR